MEFFKSIGKVASDKISKNAKELYKSTRDQLEKTTSNLKDTISSKHSAYKFYHPSSTKDFLIEINQALFWMHYPEEGLITKYAAILNTTFGDNYKIWNVSEYSYDTNIFNNQVFEYVNVGYPNPFLVQLFMISQEINNWVRMDPQNIAIVHCQKSQTRSALVLGCYLFDKGSFPHPFAAITDVCKKLNASASDFLRTCNSVYANYYSLLNSSMKLNNKKVKLLKVIFSSAPKVDLSLEDRKNPLFSEQKCLRPYLQVFAKNNIAFSSLEKDYKFTEFEEGEPATFNLNKLEVDGDILIRVRHFVSREVRYPVVRIMLNTCMLVEQNSRFYLGDLDLGNLVEAEKDFYIDVIAEYTGENSDCFDAIHKIRLRQKFLNNDHLHKLTFNSEDDNEDDFIIGDNSAESPVREIQCALMNEVIPGQNELSNDENNKETDIEGKEPEKIEEKEFENTEEKEDKNDEENIPEKAEHIEKIEEKKATKKIAEKVEEKEPENSLEKEVEKVEEKELENKNDEEHSNSKENGSDHQNSEDSDSEEMDMEEYIKNLEKKAK